MNLETMHASRRLKPQGCAAIEILELARAHGVVLCTNGHDIAYWPTTGRFMTAELEVAIDQNRIEILALLRAEWNFAERCAQSERVH